MTEVQVGIKVEPHARQAEGQDQLHTWIKCLSSGPLILVSRDVMFFSQGLL